MKLPGYGSRNVTKLSGGQRQRVALARALAPGPSVLLLDEPLAALDEKVRREMQLELRRIQKETGTTFLYVTHDQEEALTMSDRVAVFREGCCVQCDVPAELFEHPRTRFVASFFRGFNVLRIPDRLLPAARPARRRDERWVDGGGHPRRAGRPGRRQAPTRCTSPARSAGHLPRSDDRPRCRSSTTDSRGGDGRPGRGRGGRASSTVRLPAPTWWSWRRSERGRADPRGHPRPSPPVSAGRWTTPRSRSTTTAW